MVNWDTWPGNVLLKGKTTASRGIVTSVASQVTSHAIALIQLNSNLSAGIITKETTRGIIETSRAESIIQMTSNTEVVLILKSQDLYNRLILESMTLVLKVTKRWTTGRETTTKREASKKSISPTRATHRRTRHLTRMSLAISASNRSISEAKKSDL